MADIIVNHISADSEPFRDVIEHGPSSPHWSLFLRREDVFPSDQADAKEQIEKIYRPRPGAPFTRLRLADGSEHEFWTTFSSKQLDIDVEGAAGRAYLESILDRFATAGIRETRLDAAGYAIKRRGTPCFMLPETDEFIRDLSDAARARGIDALVEIHSHFRTQIGIAANVNRVYDFALPPLVLHTLYTGNCAPLKRWLSLAPRNCVTVLDTHDGIGIVDVARHGDRAGLLSDDEVASLVETIHRKTDGASRRASGHSASNLDVYQVNSTYYDALGRNDAEYLIARAIQFFAPGTPQVYYVGLLAGENDMELVERTGVGRDINRHYYSLEEVRSALRKPVVEKLCDLIRLRNRLSVFEGHFSMPETTDDQIALRWDSDAGFAELRVNPGLGEGRVVFRENGCEQCLRIDSRSIPAVPQPR